MLYFEDGGSWCVSKNTLVSETVGIQHMPKIELVTKPKWLALFLTGSSIYPSLDYWWFVVVSYIFCGYC